MTTRLTALGLVASSLLGCATPQSEVTPVAIAEAGVSATSDAGAVWLAADRPGLSNVGKDFLFVGPMTMNRDGLQRRYLWFALGSTIDRRITGAPGRSMESVIISVDGVPMTFDVETWSAPSGGLPYVLPIEPELNFVALVTRSQLERLGTARAVEAYVLDGDGRSPAYRVARGDLSAWWRAPGNGSLANAVE
ncbi:MAG: hypothetical protein AAF417_10195 [Pseudomonadota bacterium]